jgi:hypothetical protein
MASQPSLNLSSSTDHRPYNSLISDASEAYQFTDDRENPVGI